jgi:hypothetical protein
VRGQFPELSKEVVLRVGGPVMFAREEVTGGPLPRGRKAGVHRPACKQGGVSGAEQPNGPGRAEPYLNSQHELSLLSDKPSCLDEFEG